ncbi:MAG: SDR family oxidoreductase [Spirochaetales bacterium]|nr:SDR family oxidoreductase [Spirochaetales bacterium]MCP5485834.1 SDR family oxidoreductase [Spirochaetales bacterium]
MSDIQSAVHSKREGGVALVTGAGTRLGRAVALFLAGLDYVIAVHYNTSTEGAASTVREIQERGGHAESFPCDFADARNCAGLMQQAGQALGTITLLVNCASAYDQAPIRETDTELLRREFEANLIAPFQLIRAFADQTNAGMVVNFIDNKTAFVQPDYAAYLLSKHALAHLTEMAAAELGPGIRVNGIAPGVILPPERRNEEYIRWRADGIPIGRTGEVAHILSALRFLIENEFVNGQILRVDGGESVLRPGRHAGNYPGHPDRQP